MKQKITVLMLAFCLSTSVGMSNAKAEYNEFEEKSMKNADLIISGGPVDIMPPQKSIFSLK